MATSQDVHKTRSLRRHPPSEQVQKDLLESLRAKPRDPKGSREETDHFVFPPLDPRSASQAVQLLNVDGSQLFLVWEPAEEVEHFQDMPPVSETRTCADVPWPEDADLDEMIDCLPDESEELFKPPLEEVTGDSGAQSSTSRPRLLPPPTLERKRETSEVSKAASKLQRISSVFRTSDHPMRVFDLRVSAVTTKQPLEVPVAVNQDEDELTLEERFKNPLFWQSADFT